ncbi:MAG: choice-of-anchor tandem repeat GloVer-containing protein, partial [Gaiellaceae bacterium]
SDGAGPEGGLIRDSENTLYGVTSTGGANEWGTVFKLDASGNFTLLYTFKGAPDGAQPTAALLRDSAGDLYGTTASGGPNNVGIVFKIDPFGNETILHSFSSGTDGAFPLAPLSGNPEALMYGTTSKGGTNNSGTIFQIDASGNESVIHTFIGTDGSDPEAGLLPVRGYLLGTTRGGGSDECGTVFALTPSRTVKLLHQFTCAADGEYPSAPLVVDGAGTVYGTTFGETDPVCGNTGLACGTAFKISRQSLGR